MNRKTLTTYLPPMMLGAMISGTVSMILTEKKQPTWWVWVAAVSIGMGVVLAVQGVGYLISLRRRRAGAKEETKDQAASKG